MLYPEIDKFVKHHEYLICIDSDGTAMDAMNSKHKRCFGPCFVKEWELDANNDIILTLWNEVNLYSLTRGVNRFIALVEVLKRLDGVYLQIDDFDVIKNWVETASELSNKSLKAEIEKDNSLILARALKWSLAVNEEISRLTVDDNKPFEGVREFLAHAFDKVDIAVISSANMSAIFEEWHHYDMLKYIGTMTSQEIGTKEECIHKLLQKGYDISHVLMVGDAHPDAEAAKASGVYFYPVLADHEKESWTKLKEIYLQELLTGHFEKHQNDLVIKFENNLLKI